MRAHLTTGCIGFVMAPSRSINQRTLSPGEMAASVAMLAAAHMKIRATMDFMTDS